jgi:hypothetical protein
MEPDQSESGPDASSGDATGAASTSEGTAIALVLGAMTVGVVAAFDAHAMVVLVWTWTATWIAVLQPRVTDRWPRAARRVVVATGTGWLGLWLGMLAGTTEHDHPFGLYSVVGWPREILLWKVPAAPAIVTNFVWAVVPPPGTYRPHVLHSDDCLGNFLVFTLIAAALLLPCPHADLRRVCKVLRWLVPAVTLAVLATRRLSHAEW